MDMREASAMTEASGLPNEQDGIETAAGARSGSAEGMSNSGRRYSDSRPAAAHSPDHLHKIVLEAPLQSLFVAFLLGVLVGRRL
jgi:hypothetical protein